MNRIVAALPGLALAAAIAAVATLVGAFVPLVGSAVPAIVIGVAVRLAARPGASFGAGISFAGRRVLQGAVVILGLQLSIGEAARVGLESLPVMLGTLAICLVAAWLLGRWLGVVGDLRTLIGVGTGICGASAISAVAPIIGAASADIAYAVSTIFLFNIAAVIVFPLVGHLLGMSQHAFGLFAGTAVNDTSSVVAAATTYGQDAANYAVVVKLVRTLMIIPVSVGLAAWVDRARLRTSAPPTGPSSPTLASSGVAPAPPRRLTWLGVLRLVPWFLVGFAVAALVNSTGVIPTMWHPGIVAVSQFLIATALAAIGLSTDIGALRRAGVKPLLLGGVLWLVVSLSSLGLQWATTGL
ncbi:putative sulfate exporter family transporter [Gryllotalpicola sp.]|uniref:YeiH family protein n=1 Tax=Gryllotalpicola sp. TaxID=1932787 RepID=UPI002612F431|nr:putative sulfate exporter family transporter [Gryllotalpicola sp.]